MTDANNQRVAPKRQRRKGLEIIEQLRAERLRQGLTMQDIADRAGYTLTAIHRLERGYTYPRVSTLLDYAQVLGVRIRIDATLNKGGGDE